MKLTKVLEAIQDELKKPLPEPRVVAVKKRRKKMAKKAKQEVVEDEDLDETEAEDEGDEDMDEEDEAPAKSKSKSKKAAKPAKSAKKAAKPSDDGFVSLQDLASEAEIEPQSARVKLRDSDLEKPEGGRWRWKEGSKALKEARKVLGL